jgi:hypothetical protein
MIDFDVDPTTTILGIDRDGRDVTVGPRDHEPGVAHDLVGDLGHEVGARRLQCQLRHEEPERPRARVDLRLDPQHRAQVSSPQRGDRHVHRHRDRLGRH